MPDAVEAIRCGCGQAFNVPLTLSMPAVDKRAREWMKQHATTCAEMQRRIAAQGGKVGMSR